MKKTKKTTAKPTSFQWNEVTPFSKYLAMALFITLPLVAFLLGMSFQQEISVAACDINW